MDKKQIRLKFGDDYLVNEMTYQLGIHIRFTEYLASRFKYLNVLETCTGGGFTSISLARYANHVYSFEIDGIRMNEAINNAKIARIDQKITFSNADIMQILNKGIKQKIDAAFLDPDWNTNINNHIYKFLNSNTRPPSDILLENVFNVTPNVTLIQPPFVNEAEFEQLPEHELESLYLEGSHELYALHFGSLIRRVGKTEFKV
jgi:16S rRNA G966 N2-methylase RsmD